jgi:GTPase SAR1 family protein
MGILENFFITQANSLLNRRARSKAQPPSSVEQIPIGRLIPPDETLPSSEIVTLSQNDRDRHLYLLGATGVGKTTLLMRLIESDIERERAFCVVDLRGDLVERILLRLAASAPPEAWRERLLLLDLRETEYVVGFNPLVGEGDVYDRALYLLSVIKNQSESWGIQLEETLRCSLIALAETGWSLLEVGHLLTNPSFRSQVLRSVSDPSVLSFFATFEKLSANNQLTWTLPVLNKITPFTSLPTLRLMFGGRQPLPLRRLMDTKPGMIVLVSLAVDKYHDVSRLAGGLFVSSFQNAIMSRVDMPESKRVPANLIVDDFESMANERFASIVAVSRRFGLGLTLSHQNISQLPTSLREVLRNNVRTQLYFQTGAHDARELSGEISSDIPIKDIRAMLISQKTGQAYLVRRGQESVRVQVNYVPEPSVTSAQVRAVRQASLEFYGRPRADVEMELKERDQAWRSSSNPATPEAPVYVINHEKRETFKPTPPPPSPDTPPKPSNRKPRIPPINDTKKPLSDPSVENTTTENP